MDRALESQLGCMYQLTITIISDQSWSQCHPSVAYKSLNTLHQSIKQFISQLTMHWIEIFTNSQLLVKPTTRLFFYALLYNLWNRKVLYWCSKHSSRANVRVPFLHNTRRREVQYRLNKDKSDVSDISVVMRFGSDHLFETIFLLPPLYLNLTGSEIA